MHLGRLRTPLAALSPFHESYDISNYECKIVDEITCKVHLGYIHDRTGAQVVVSLIAVGFKISIFVIVIVTTMIITIIIIILIPAINDQPRSINRRCWMMGQPRAFQRCVAVLGDSLLVGHVSGGGGDGE